MNAQDVTNEEEMLKTFHKFVLVEDDFQGKEVRLQGKIVKMPPWISYEDTGKRKTDIQAKEDCTYFKQIIDLEGYIRISAEYAFFSSREDAMKATNSAASGTAEVASAWWFGPKESMGLTKWDSAYNYGGVVYPSTLLFNCNNVRVRIHVSLERDKKANEVARLVADYAKRIIGRINKAADEQRKKEVIILKDIPLMRTE